jgi:hypothetical protein
VITDPRAGNVHETERALRAANAHMPIIRIPFDLDLPRAGWFEHESHHASRGEGALTAQTLQLRATAYEKPAHDDPR